MNLKKLFSGALLAGTLCAAAQTLTPNIRMIPGGLEIIDRENTSTPAFDTRQKLKPTDQRLVISFMEIQGENIQKNNFTNRDFRQTASLKLGKDGSDFNFSASAVRKNENTVDLTLSVKRNTPADIGQKPFFSLTFTRALLGIPFQLNMVDPAGKSWRHTLVYSKEKQSGWLWSSHGEHRVHGIKIPMNHGELTITGFSAPAMACKYNIGTGNLRIYMDGKVFGGIEATLSVSYKPYPAETLNLRQFANMGFQDDTGDDATGGWTDQGPENDLRMMTAGKRMFLNMTFDVIDPKTNNGKSVLALGCPERAFLPKQAVVPVGGKRFRYLYFLHADAWPKKKEVGTILVKYTDGTEQKISVKDGTDVINWWAPQSRPNAIVAWQGQNRYEVLGLAMSRFAVQNKPVDSLTLTSSGNSVWLIVAISGTNADFIPFPSVEAETVETPVTMDSRDWMEYTFTVARKTPVKGSALDFSGLLDAPAGKYGFVQCKGENFVFEKRPDIPVRFNGTNLCGEISTHFTHRESDALADQLAALGLNAARLHHFDEWLVDHTKTDGSVDPKRLDNLHYLFSALKKRGIYVTIDLFTMRTSGFPVKLKGMFDAKTRLLFSKELRANLMNFARTMLTPVNPYTGLALKDDPALITVGLINEDPIISGGHDELAYPNKNPVQHQAIKAVFEAWGKKHGVAIPEKPGHELYICVMNEHHIDIYREMTEELRKMGVRQPTSDMSVSAMRSAPFRARNMTMWTIITTFPIRAISVINRAGRAVTPTKA